MCKNNRATSRLAEHLRSIDSFVSMAKSDPRILTQRNAKKDIGSAEIPVMVDKQYAPAREASPSLLQDRMSIAILILLYTLQGIPMGLSASIPLILKEKGASYEALSLFSLVSVPFSLKLIWAPLVDSFYSLSFGRRKTWLVPVQFITGLVMIFGAGYVEQWLDVTVIGPDGHNHSSPAVAQLTGFFFFLYFLMATQDIAVDGWALTMLSRDSVGYASICNTIGQVLGVFIANQGFIALSDSRWCHKYLGVNTGGLVTLPDFMHFWGYVFIVVTAFIAVFKKEEATDPNDHPEGLFDTCRQIVAIFRLPAVQSIAVILLTCRMCVAPADAIFSFKLQVYSATQLALLSEQVLIGGCDTANRSMACPSRISRPSRRC
jgi:PAT family acetyl-CoA transporter-like MFS transporter 1